MALYNWHNRYQQQARWTSQLRHYLYSKVQVNQANRVLEVGCGTGVILSDPPLKIIQAKFGLDINENHLRQAKQVIPDSLLCAGDGLMLPFPASCFGITICHFFLLWVNDPGSAIREMIRVTRKGGYILAMAEPDYGGRIDFPEKFMWIGQLQGRALENQGAHPEIGRQLSSLFGKNGLNNIECGVMGGQWIHPDDVESIENEWDVLQQDLGGLIPANVFTQFKELDVLSWEKRERTIFVPTFYALGQV
jgi:ubiquinone/menaquinone biosynthesis C-methylase UbiE